MKTSSVTHVNFKASLDIYNKKGPRAIQSGHTNPIKGRYKEQFAPALADI